VTNISIDNRYGMAYNGVMVLMESVCDLTQDDFNSLSADEQQDFWRLYMEYCHRNHETPTIKSFLIWVEER